jgi:hypothetical protein
MCTAMTGEKAHLVIASQIGNPLKLISYKLEKGLFINCSNYEKNTERDYKCLDLIFHH